MWENTPLLPPGGMGTAGVDWCIKHTRHTLWFWIGQKIQYSFFLCLSQAFSTSIPAFSFGNVTFSLRIGLPSRRVSGEKCPFSSRWKRSKVFSSTPSFSRRFHLSTLKRSQTMTTTGTRDCTCVLHNQADANELNTNGHWELWGKLHGKLTEKVA